MKYLKLLILVLIIAFIFFVAFKISFSKKNLIKKKIIINGFSRYYYISNKDLVRSDSSNVLIFFHGLENEDKISKNTFQIFNEMEKKAENTNLVLIFPIGIKGAFPNNKELLAWGPDEKEKNVNFVNQLADELKNEYSVNALLIGGFSNGAYFATDLLNSDNETFQGYWLQAGGSNKKINSNLVKSKIVLEVGLKDPWHLKSMRNLKKQLIENGWILNKNLIYRELDFSHNLDISYFDENMNFLLD